MLSLCFAWVTVPNGGRDTGDFCSFPGCSRCTSDVWSRWDESYTGWTVAMEPSVSLLYSSCFAAVWGARCTEVIHVRGTSVGTGRSQVQGLNRYGGYFCSHQCSGMSLALLNQPLHCHHCSALLQESIPRALLDVLRPCLAASPTACAPVSEHEVPVLLLAGGNPDHEMPLVPHGVLM